VSVGVPTYNQADYLAETLDSLLAQNVAPLEIVVSENHSTDATPRVLEAYADRVRIVRPARHLPMAASWNYLLAQMRGEWAFLLSSDDVAEPDCVAAFGRGIRRHPPAVLVRGDVERIDAAGARLGGRRYRGPRVVEHPQNLAEHVAAPCTVFGAAAWRRAAWEQAGGFPEDFALAADWAFWLRLAPLGAFVHEPEVLMRYRETHRPPEVEATRMPAWIEDLQRLYEELLPPLVSAAGLCEARTRRAARACCLEILRRAQELFPVEDRPPLVELIRDWATRCGLQGPLERFAGGATIPRKGYGPLRSAASGVSSGFKRLRRWLGLARRHARRPARETRTT
jgi:glycosyltransferase involved in cell wall biosynthesis